MSFWAKRKIKKTMEKKTKRINIIFPLTIMILLIGCAIVYLLSRFYFYDEIKNPEEEESVTLNWMVVGEEFPDTDRVIDEFNSLLKEKLPGVKVDFTIASRDNWQEEWEAAMLMGTKLDLAWFSNDVMDFEEEIRKGSLMAIDFALEAYGEDILETVPDKEWGKVRYDDITYGVPTGGITYQAIPGVYAKKYYMERYGDIGKIGEVNRENPWSTGECYDVFEDFLSGIKEAGDIGTGVSALTFSKMADKGYEGIYGWNSPFAIRLYEDKVKVVNRYEEPAYRIYFDKMSDWYSKGYIREDIAEVLDPQAEDGKNRGNVLYIGEYSEKGEGIEQPEPEYEYVCEPLQEERFISYEGTRNAIVVPKTSIHPAEAVKVLNLLYSKEGKELYRLIVNGIEGDHYILLKNDTVVRRHDNDERLLYSISPYSIGNIYNNYERFSGQFKSIEKYNSEALSSPIQGFELDTRMIADRMAAIDLVVSDYKPALSKGHLDNHTENYRDFIREMKRAGSDEVIKEIQRQVDEFLENKDTKVN